MKKLSKKSHQSNKEIFDDNITLFFCTIDVQSLKIPSFIKHIGPNSFNDYQYLKIIEILEDSVLQTIGYCAFASTLIMKFTVPPQRNR